MSAEQPERLSHEQRLQDGADNLAAAIDYANEYGWSITVCCPPDHTGVSEQHAKSCKQPGKRPLHSWKACQEKPMTVEQIEELFRRWPTANVGAATGPASGFVRIDVDSAAAAKRLDEMSKGDLPETWEFTSGKPHGRALLYGIPAGVTLCTTSETPDGKEGELRFQAKGAQTVLPPSRHPSGRRYQWVDGHSPCEIPLAPMPAWLVDHLSTKPQRAAAAPSVNGKAATANAHEFLDALPCEQPESNGRLKEPSAQEWTDRQKAEWCLEHIDASRGEPRDSWLDVAKCLHSVDTSETMRNLWKDWSRQTCPKKYDAADCDRVWASLNAEGNSRGKLTIASLVKWAKEDGADLPWAGLGRARSTHHKAIAVAANGKPAAAGDADDDNPLERDDDPHRLARLYLNKQRHRDGLYLRHHRDEYHRYVGGRYRPVEDKEIRGEVVECVKEEFDAIAVARFAAWQAKRKDGEAEDDRKNPAPRVQPVTTKLIGNVLQAQASLAALPGAQSAPCWIDPPRWTGLTPITPPCPATEVVPFRNKLLHLPGYIAGKPCLFPHTPAFFSPNILNYDFDPRAGAPGTWMAFLAKLWANDQQAIETLQEWFGYCLLPDTSQQKILMIVGPRRSGKGTIARVLRALVGIENTCGPTLASLGTNFGLWPLLGKMVAIISDARLSGRTDVAVVTERLLSISGEDAQTVDRKHLSPVTCQLPVRFVILTNELPRLNDPSGALTGRLILLRQTESWYGKEDTTLTAKLLDELPGIMLWAIEGWRRLHERGHFVQPDSGRRLIENMEDLASPIGAFIRERCEVGPAFEVITADLFYRWQQWCTAKGREPGSEQTFGRDLHAALPCLDVRQSRQMGGRVRFYVGIRPRHGEEPLPD